VAVVAVINKANQQPNTTGWQSDVQSQSC